MLLAAERGVSLEEIARLVGHSSTATTEQVYQHELRPVLQKGAEVMDDIFRPEPDGDEDADEEASWVRDTKEGVVERRCLRGHSEICSPSEGEA